MTITIRRARKTDAGAIGRVHVETWQSAYAGLLPDAMLVRMSDVRQSAWWSRACSLGSDAGKRSGEIDTVKERRPERQRVDLSR